MRIFGLFGIDAYLRPRLLTLVRAENIIFAAKRLGGDVSDTIREKNPDHKFYFVETAVSGVFRPGINTARIMAMSKVDAGNSYWAHKAEEAIKGFREFKLGEVPSLD